MVRKAFAQEVTQGGCPPNILAGQTRKAEESQMQGKAEDISLDFWSQKVYRFLVVDNSVLKESIGAIWFNEEDSPLSSFWW